MNKKKGIQYYLKIFVYATIAVVLFASVDGLSSGGFDFSFFLTLMVAPVAFTLFLFLFDTIIELVVPKRFKQRNVNKDEYSDFLKIVNREVETKTELSIEDFRRLRDSERFQKSIRQAFKIFKDGETKEVTYDYLSKKFKKDSREFIALDVVLKEVKKLKENS